MAELFYTMRGGMVREFSFSEMPLKWLPMVELSNLQLA
jgi:hypothetical protein